VTVHAAIGVILPDVKEQVKRDGISQDAPRDWNQTSNCSDAEPAAEHERVAGFERNRFDGIAFQPAKQKAGRQGLLTGQHGWADRR